MSDGGDDMDRYLHETFSWVTDQFEICQGAAGWAVRWRAACNRQYYGVKRIFSHILLLRKASKCKVVLDEEEQRNTLCHTLETFSTLFLLKVKSGFFTTSPAFPNTGSFNGLFTCKHTHTSCIIIVTQKNVTFGWPDHKPNMCRHYREKNK